jgi:hypothetical protein
MVAGRTHPRITMGQYPIVETKLLSIHQPSYFCWLGLLDKIAKSRTHVVMDAVQLSDGLFQNRNKFLTIDGKSKFLTIPIPKKNYMGKWICDLLIHQDKWQRDHLNFLTNNYRRHPFYKEVIDEVMPVFETKYERLIDAIMDSMMISMKLFGISTPVVRMSTLPFDSQAHKSELVLSVVKAAGFDAYLSGEGAKQYMDSDLFARHAIKVVDHGFEHPAYTQRTRGECTFQPGLANLDLLFNLGVVGAREVFWQNVQSDV